MPEDVELLEPETVEPSEFPVLGPLGETFKGVYQIPESEIEDRANSIMQADPDILQFADIQAVKVYAQVCIRLERLDRVITGPMFQLTSKGILVPHPIHAVYERERKFYERMSMRLGQNPIARKAILGVKSLPPGGPNANSDFDPSRMSEAKTVEDVAKSMFRQ